MIVISWRDVPAQVLVKSGRETAKVQLSHRLQALRLAQLIFERARSVTSRCTATQWVYQPVASAIGTISISSQNGSPLFL